MKLLAEPILDCEYHNSYTRLTGDVYRSVILKLGNINEKELNLLHKVIKSNTYSFGILGFHKVIKDEYKNRFTIGHSYRGIRNKVKLDWKINVGVNIFIYGPNAMPIGKEILKLISEESRESDLEKKVKVE